MRAHTPLRDEPSALPHTGSPAHLLLPLHPVVPLARQPHVPSSSSQSTDGSGCQQQPGGHGPTASTNRSLAGAVGSAAGRRCSSQGWAGGEGMQPGAAPASCCPGCHRATAVGCTDPQPPQKMGSALLGFALLGEQNSSPSTDCCCLPGASQIGAVPQILSGTLTLGFPCLLAVPTSSLCPAATCCLPQDSMPAARSHPLKARAASRAAATGSSAGDRSNL